MTKYFINCKNLDELKKSYKAAAQKHPPDVGGDTATMQAINAEYEARFAASGRMKSRHTILQGDSKPCLSGSYN